MLIDSIGIWIGLGGALDGLGRFLIVDKSLKSLDNSLDRGSRSSDRLYQILVSRVPGFG